MIELRPEQLAKVNKSIPDCIDDCVTVNILIIVLDV